MKIFRVNSLSEYLALLEQSGLDRYIYRGQNEPFDGIRANGFRPYTGERDSDKIFNIDCISKDYFNQVISKLTADEKTYFLAFCQHHGIPTNLIDFSFSPLIALFFACQGKSFSNLCLEEEGFSPFAQVYLIRRARLLDITDIITQLGNNNLFTQIYNNADLRISLFDKLSFLFEQLDEASIAKWLIDLIELYKSNHTDLWEISDENTMDLDYKDLLKDDSIFTYQLQLNEKPLSEVLLDLYNYIFNNMEDERIPLESDVFDGSPDLYPNFQVAAMTYILLLANLIQIFDNDNHGSKELFLNLDLYFIYTPPNLFDRIENQRGLFIYQPYIYSQDNGHPRILSLQNINADINIEVNNYQSILNELDELGVNLGTIYCDLDNIARSVVTTYKRKNL